jgi:hypothetical protein
MNTEATEPTFVSSPAAMFTTFNGVVEPVKDQFHWYTFWGSERTWLEEPLILRSFDLARRTGYL